MASGRGPAHWAPMPPWFPKPLGCTCPWGSDPRHFHPLHAAVQCTHASVTALGPFEVLEVSGAWKKEKAN